VEGVDVILKDEEIEGVGLGDECVVRKEEGGGGRGGNGGQRGGRRRLKGRKTEVKGEENGG